MLTNAYFYEHKCSLWDFAVRIFLQPLCLHQNFFFFMWRMWGTHQNPLTVSSKQTAAFSASVMHFIKNFLLHWADLHCLYCKHWTGWELELQDDVQVLHQLWHLWPARCGLLDEMPSVKKQSSGMKEELQIMSNAALESQMPVVFCWVFFFCKDCTFHVT